MSESEPLRVLVVDDHPMVSQIIAIACDERPSLPVHRHDSPPADDDNQNHCRQQRPPTDETGAADVGPVAEACTRTGGAGPSSKVGPRTRPPFPPESQRTTHLKSSAHLSIHIIVQPATAVIRRRAD